MRSFIETFEIDIGRRNIVLASADLLEAPNWSPDGQTLVVNGDGHLFRLSVANPKLETIDTGCADECNNDHGLCPKGYRIAISHRLNGDSTIFTLPFEGGEPVQVTARNPSYWHGWSPDGRRLAFVGRRDGAFDIFTIPVAGGAEKRLTRDMGHCDGPDYTPDGAWIWFNSDKTGSAQLWRMRVDGSGLQQMTDDAFVNWFPHPDPTGKHVLYLAYPPGTTGHPRDRDVVLRLMPAEGGEARDLCRFNGGQGTINVPCWAPDGRAFAFVSYAAPE
ncbi:TolB family protein [Algicella marina]|uniref:Uncharacterized protein n=1 Tax=Algicella marina TaxID=2683284 RepID=A0A6P1T3Q8_9RHOB|nr:PD40 domain-containing protein [Algicella marina]QHQ36106.1 hypothetical protein GO499_13455 [Algicella marina]